MKSIDDVIKSFACCHNPVDYSPNCRECPYKKYDKCWDEKLWDALQYLKIYRAEHQMKPMTWTDLMLTGLIGNPLFESDRRRWYLVADSALDNDSWLDLVDDCGKIHRLEPLDIKRWHLHRRKGDMNE